MVGYRSPAELILDFTRGIGKPYPSQKSVLRGEGGLYDFASRNGFSVDQTNQALALLIQTNQIVWQEGGSSISRP